MPANDTIDYYPFGMQMPGKVMHSGLYRYGFQGQEKDDEIAGTGNSYTAEFWQYDSRLGRRWNVDPMATQFADLSSYCVFDNNPIFWIDSVGLSAKDWKSEVDKKTGEPIYIAEEGDNMLTFVAQYEISSDKAFELFSKTNYNTSVGDEIRGAGFLRYNLFKTEGRGLFNLDFWSPRTMQRAIDHMDFALKYANANDLSVIDINKTFNYDPSDVSGLIGGVSVTFKGMLNGNIPVAMDLTLAKGNPKMTIKPSYTWQSEGLYFGNMQAQDFFEYRSPKDMAILRFYTPSKYGSVLSKYLYRN